mmetsp:Transcript_6271/g.16160  ORF Transcript_6271/g.16160 Transcript_6271/m.16160 type:complete len:365 (-) Transcript_6271:320-1414(-)
MGVALNSPPWAHQSCVGAFVFTIGHAQSHNNNTVKEEFQDVFQRPTSPVPILRSKARPAGQHVEHFRPRVETAVAYSWSPLADGCGVELANDPDGLLFDLDEPPRSRRQHHVGFDLDNIAVLADMEARELSLFAQHVKMLTLPTRPFQLQLLHDVKRTKDPAARGRDGVDVMPMTVELARLGYDVIFRESMGGYQMGINYLTNLRHEFAYVVTSDNCRAETADAAAQSLDERVLIEFNLRQQFAIASPTKRFEKVLQLVPEEFVGTKSQLVDLIALVSIEIEQAFKARNLELPPWRQARSLLSKWFPRMAKDEVPSTVAAQRGCGASAPGQTWNGIPWLQSSERRNKSKVQTLVETSRLESHVR